MFWKLSEFEFSHGCSTVGEYVTFRASMQLFAVEFLLCHGPAINLEKVYHVTTRKWFCIENKAKNYMYICHKNLHIHPKNGISTNHYPTQVRDTSENYFRTSRQNGSYTLCLILTSQLSGFLLPFDRSILDRYSIMIRWNHVFNLPVLVRSVPRDDIIWCNLRQDM